MRKTIYIAIAVAFVGCTTTVQKQSFDTLYTLEQSATAAVDSYYTLVLKGQLPTNSVPQVSKAFNDLQAAIAVAEDVVQFNTNALAPAVLVTEAGDFINLINQVKGGK